MRPPSSTPSSKKRYPSLVVIIGLSSGILITTLVWLKLPNQFIMPLFWLSLSLVGLGSFLYLRKPLPSRPRWVAILAILASVSLVFLFPELFGPACGGVPRAFASPSPRCGTCLDYVCEWNYKKHQEWCYCDEWDTTGCTQSNPPAIQAGLNCSQWGSNGWCVGSFSLNLTATDPQGLDVMISGELDETNFACPASPATSTCVVPLPQGDGISYYTATSASELTASGSSTYKRDSVLPQINGSLSGTAGNNGWFLSTMSVNASASDPVPGSGMAALTYNLNGAGWTPYAGPLSLPDGIHTLSFQARDIAGNVTTTNQTVRVDTVTPVLNLSLTGTTGTGGWYQSNVQVSAAASDAGSGLSTFEYELDGAGWTSYTVPLELSDGDHSLSMRVTDIAGNSVAWAQSFPVDTLTPALDLSLTGTAGTNGWYRSNVQVSATASDSGSGLGALEYDLDGAGWTPYTAPLELGDGDHTLSMRVTDMAGNSVPWAQSFQVDTLTPALDLTIDGMLGTGGWYTSPVRINLAASDPGSDLSNASGLSVLEYNLDGAGWVPYNAPLELGNGAHSLDVHAVDAAGNITAGAQVFQVDGIAPSVDVNQSGAQGTAPWFVSVVQVEAVAADSISGLSALEVKVDGGEWRAYTGPLAFGDGPHSYRFRAWDNAGLQILTPLQALQVDTIPPAISLPALWELGDKARFQLHDNGSGLASVRLVIEDGDGRYPKVTWDDVLSSYTYDGEINWDARFQDGSLAPSGGKYYARLKVIDQAGNESQKSGQIEIPLLDFFDTVFPSPGNLVSGTGGSNPVITLIPGSDIEEELLSQLSQESAPSTLSFGGGNNDAGATGEQSALNAGGGNNGADATGEQSALNVGGGNNGAAQPTGASAGMTSFEAGGQSTSSPLSNATSNLLWGATAAAAVGAFVAELARKKEEEEAKAREREEAKAAERAARQERREDSNYRQEIKSNKLAELEIVWASERALAEQRKQAAIDPRVSQKEEEVEAEHRAYGNKPQELGASYYQYLQQKAYENFRAQEMESPAAVTPPKEEEKEESWWDRTKSFLGEQVIQPINSYIYQPYIKPAVAQIAESASNTSAWLNENVYQPYIQPEIEEAKQKISSGLTWVNETVYQPYVKPAIDKTVQEVTKGITWVNEKIIEPYVQPFLEKAITKISDGIAWANEKIYQPYIQPALAYLDEKVYQPHIKPLLDKTQEKIADYSSWVNQTFYQPLLQPIVSDINQYIYQPLVKPLQDEITAWWNETWEKYGEQVHEALDLVGFIPAFGDACDAINGLIYLAEGRYLEASLSALAIVPVLGDLGKVGKWGAKLSMEVVEEVGEKVVKEVVEEIAEEVVEVAAEKTVREVGEVLVEKGSKEIGEEVSEKIILKETGEELIDKTTKESLKNLAEKITKEVREEFIENISQEIAEKTTKEVTNTVVTKVAKENIEAVPTISAKKVSNTVVEETVEETFQQFDEETVQFISSLREKYGDDMVDRFLPFCEKYDINPKEVLTRPPAEGQTLIGWGLGIDNPINPANHPLVNLNLTKDEISKILEQSVKNPDSKVVVLGFGGGANKPYYILGDEIDGCFLSIPDDVWAPFDQARANFLTDLNLPFIEKGIEQRKIFIFNVDKKTIIDPINAGRFSLPELKLIELPSNNYVRVELGEYELLVPQELEESFMEHLPPKLLGEL